MEFVKKYPYDKAIEEINSLLDKKKVLPRRREALEQAIESVAEAIMFGYVSIKEDGTITQTLIESVGTLTELVYKPHVTAAVMNKELGTIKLYNQPNVNLAYIAMYTERSASEINKLEPADRNIADSISFFFQ
jgi:hypothetical protein